MNTPTQSDLASIRRRLQDLEYEVRSLGVTSPVPAALPVDKMQLADYAKGTAPLASEEEDEEDIEVFAQPNLTRGELQELTCAIRDYLDWSDPQPHLTVQSWQMVNSTTRERLERALQVAEQELRRVTDA
jgi:hypothetical protein